MNKNTIWFQQKCIQNFSWKMWREETTWRLRYGWKDNIKMDLKEICEDVDWTHLL